MKRTSAVATQSAIASHAVVSLRHAWARSGSSVVADDTVPVTIDCGQVSWIGGAEVRRGTGGASQPRLPCSLPFARQPCIERTALAVPLGARDVVKPPVATM